MTVANHIPTIKHYTGDGILFQFDIPFEFLDKDHLDVYLDDVLQDPAVYTVINCQERAGDNGCLEGADLVFTTTPATGVKIAIIRCTPATNESDWRPNLKFQAEVKERALDKLTMILQEIHDRAGLIAKVAGEGPQCSGDENGVSVCNLIDARVALLWERETNSPGPGYKYSFIYVCSDTLKSQCYECKDQGIWKYANEFNGCSTLPTIQDDFLPAQTDYSKKTYVMMYTLKDASGNTYFRFNAPQACSDRSSCGGGDVDPVIQWNQWVKCSSGAHFGWQIHDPSAPKFYYDHNMRECIREKDPIVSVTGTDIPSFLPIFSREELTAVASCGANKCFPCDECTCSASSTVTFTYTPCALNANNAEHSGDCINGAVSPTAVDISGSLNHEGDCIYNYAGTINYLPSVGPGANQWKISIQCVGDMWQVSAAGSAGLAGGCTSGIESIGWQNAPYLRCTGGRPQGTVELQMAEVARSTDIWPCGSILMVFS